MRSSTLCSVLTAFLIFTGCAGNRTLSDSPSSLSDVNDALTNQTARLYLQGEDAETNASLVTLTRDSVYYVDGILPRHSSAPQGDRAMRQVHISDVDSIGVTINAGGGRTGALLGASPGLITGLRLGVSVANSCTPDGGWNACGLGAKVVGLYTLVVAGGGAVIGALIGNAIDDDVQTVYRAPISKYPAPDTTSDAPDSV